MIKISWLIVIVSIAVILGVVLIQFFIPNTIIPPKEVVDSPEVIKNLSTSK